MTATARSTLQAASTIDRQRDGSARIRLSSNDHEPRRRMPFSRVTRALAGTPGFPYDNAMPLLRAEPEAVCFNRNALLPYNLRLKDFELAIQDVYDFFFDVNTLLLGRSLERLDDMLRPAIMSGLLSDMLTASMAKHSRSLTVNGYFNGHPDLVVKGVYEENKVKAGSEGVEIKTTRKTGGGVDFHGARDQWLCVFVYDADQATEPAMSRRPMTFTEVYIGQVTVQDFRRNERGDLGTRTASLNREGIARFRQNWIYRVRGSP